MKVSRISLGGSYEPKIVMREALYEEREPLPAQLRLLAQIGNHRYQDLVAASMFRHLTLAEAFTATCYVLRASNAELNRRFFNGVLPSFGEEGDRMAAREMLSGLAMKEAWNHLTPDEVAGMVMAAMLDVTYYPNYGERVLETCGMGGDRGVIVNGSMGRRKTINASTLSALVLASLGYRTAKHGSYGNTSAVGSTNAIEALGVVTDLPTRIGQQRLADTNFHYSDAHGYKTIHDLSHLEPRRETVNHVIGPMTPPIRPGTRLDKVIGVNEKLHPSIMARAYALLAKHGIFTVGNVVAVCGLDTVIESGDINLHPRIREHTVLDELSPFSSVVSFCHGQEFAGSFLLTPQDFGVTFKDPYSIFVHNDEATIMAANRLALSGKDDGTQLVESLAMNAALALYLVEYMDDDNNIATHGPDRDILHTCYTKCVNALREGRTQAFLADMIR